MKKASKSVKSDEMVSTLTKPTPGLLVKSLVTAINPGEGYMQSTGLLVMSFPIIIGCNASGIVVENGEGGKKFKKGDGIFGCTRLGSPDYGNLTFHEYATLIEASDEGDSREAVLRGWEREILFEEKKVRNLVEGVNNVFIRLDCS